MGFTPTLLCCVELWLYSPVDQFVHVGDEDGNGVNLAVANLAFEAPGNEADEGHGDVVSNGSPLFALLGSAESSILGLHAGENVVSDNLFSAADSHTSGVGVELVVLSDFQGVVCVNLHEHGGERGLVEEGVEFSDSQVLVHGHVDTCGNVGVDALSQAVHVVGGGVILSESLGKGAGDVAVEPNLVGLDDFGNPEVLFLTLLPVERDVLANILQLCPDHFGHFLGIVGSDDWSGVVADGAIADRLQQCGDGCKLGSEILRDLSNSVPEFVVVGAGVGSNLSLFVEHGLFHAVD